jgi:hypothetical protein
VGSFNKKIEKWNRIKSKGKNSYVLKSLFYYEVFILLFATVYMFVFNRTTSIPEVFFTYFCTIVFYIPLGVWVGNNSWKANMRKYEKFHFL